MSYKIEYSRKADAYVIIDEETGKTIGRKYPTKPEAERQLKNISLHEPKSKRG